MNQTMTMTPKESLLLLLYAALLCVSPTCASKSIFGAVRKYEQRAGNRNRGYKGNNRESRRLPDLPLPPPGKAPDPKLPPPPPGKGPDSPPPGNPSDLQEDGNVIGKGKGKKSEGSPTFSPPPTRSSLPTSLPTSTPKPKPTPGGAKKPTPDDAKKPTPDDTKKPPPPSKAPKPAPNTPSKAPKPAPNTPSKDPKSAPNTPSKAPKSAPNTPSKAPTLSPASLGGHPTYPPVDSAVGVPTSRPNDASTTFKPTKTPTLGPTTDPTTSKPTKTPTLGPTAAPTTSPAPTVSSKPSSVPTVSLQPSPKPTRVETSPAQISVVEEGTTITHSCNDFVPDFGVYNSIKSQRVEAQAKICAQQGGAGDTLENDGVLKSMLENEIVPGFVRNRLQCNGENDYEISGVSIDIDQDSELTDTDEGDNCFYWPFLLRVDYYTRKGRRLAEDLVITDSTLAGHIYTGLFSAFNGANNKLRQSPSPYPDVRSVEFTGFRNLDIGAGTIFTGGEEGNTNSLVSSSSSESSGDFNIIPVLGVGCAGLLMVVIAVVAVQQKRHREKEAMTTHVMLKDGEDDPFDTEISPIKSGKVLGDLEPHGDSDDERTMDESLQASHLSYPQAYVINDHDNETTAEDAEVKFSSGAYWVGAQPSSSGPTFVTTDLKKAMKDLEPPSPTPRQPRGYVHDDTVDL